MWAVPLPPLTSVRPDRLTGTPPGMCLFRSARDRWARCSVTPMLLMTVPPIPGTIRATLLAPFPLPLASMIIALFPPSPVVTIVFLV